MVSLVTASFKHGGIVPENPSFISSVTLPPKLKCGGKPATEGSVETIFRKLKDLGVQLLGKTKELATEFILDNLPVALDAVFSFVVSALDLGSFENMDRDELHEILALVSLTKGKTLTSKGEQAFVLLPRIPDKLFDRQLFNDKKNNLKTKNVLQDQKAVSEMLQRLPKVVFYKADRTTIETNIVPLHDEEFGVKPVKFGKSSAKSLFGSVFKFAGPILGSVIGVVSKAIGGGKATADEEAEGETLVLSFPSDEIEINLGRVVPTHGPKTYSQIEPVKVDFTPTLSGDSIAWRNVVVGTQVQDKGVLCVPTKGSGSNLVDLKFWANDEIGSGSLHQMMAYCFEQCPESDDDSSPVCEGNKRVGFASAKQFLPASDFEFGDVGEGLIEALVRGSSEGFEKPLVFSVSVNPTELGTHSPEEWRRLATANKRMTMLLFYVNSARGRPIQSQTRLTAA